MGMSRRWRWGVVVLVATAVLGSFIPSSLAAAGEDFMRAPTTAVDGLVVVPTPSCLIPSCGKGAPAPSAPTVLMTGVAALLAVLAVGAGSRFWRRLRLSVASLPRGNSVLQFHPPQFS
jgi:hypothetical protein